MTTWKAEAVIRVKELVRRAGTPATGEPAALAGIRSDLVTVAADITSAPRSDWWTGDAITTAWGTLHRLEEELNELEDDPVRLAADARSHLARSAKRLAAFERELKDVTTPEGRCTIARQAIKDAHHTSAGRLTGERNRNRWVVILAGLLVAICVAVLVWDAVADASLLPAPTADQSVTGSQLLALVFTAGGLGGVLSAMYTLYMKRGAWDEARWLDPRPGLAAAKVAGGAVAALLGVLAVATGAVTGTYTSAGSAFLLATGFGFSQQVLTRYLDRSAKDVMEPKSAAAVLAD